MDIQLIVKEYLNNPLPLWEVEITELLIEDKWCKLTKELQITPDKYSIIGCVVKSNDILEESSTLSLNDDEIKIVFPSKKIMNFYGEHGLQPAEMSDLKFSNEIVKIKSALNVFQNVELVNKFVFKIIKSLQLIKSEYADTDISYSHPQIPFSIFFSTCAEISIKSDLRVAESILHEAMHLKLTLIENITPLIVPNAKGLYFSPWREEPRPARGVLHGLFVFKALLDFFEILYIKNVYDEKEYIESRINQIKEDLYKLSDFKLCPDLTEDGANLLVNLLP